MRCYFPCRPGQRSQRGMSLLETITAVAIASAAVFGALQMHMETMDTIRGMRDDGAAMQAVVNEMEALKALPFEQLKIGEQQPFLTEAEQVRQLYLGEGHVNIREAGVPGLREVTVEVNWLADSGRRVTRSVTTLIANHGGASDVQPPI